MLGTAEERLETLLGEHRDRLRRFALQQLSNEDDAEDSIREAFLKALVRLKAGKKIRGPVSFLFAALRDQINANHRPKVTGSIDWATAAYEAKRGQAAPSAGRRAISQPMLDEFCNYVMQLSEQEREACISGTIFGPDRREAGRQPGCARSTVREQAGPGAGKLETLYVAFEAPWGARNGVVHLSSIERECLERLARRQSVSEIAEKLKISESAVDLYLNSAVGKFAAGRRTEALAKAIYFGLISR